MRSLYFDDLYHSAFFEKEAGVTKRKKYRIRIYNLEDRLIRLECKEKMGNMVSKESINLSKDQFYSLISGGDRAFLLNEESNMPKRMYIDMQTRLLGPVVIVDYIREAYVFEPGNVRITFDKNLEAGLDTFDIFSDDVISAGALEKGTVILEIKFDDFLPDFIRNILQTRSLKSAISKYVLCRQLQMSLNPAAPFRQPCLSGVRAEEKTVEKA